MPVIETRSLTFRHGPHLAVADLDLAVPEGAVYGFLGPNGAGKTTTIRMLLGLLRPETGTLRVLGQDLASDPLPVLGRLGSMVEHPSLYPHLTAEENLRLTCRMRRLDAAAAGRALARVGLESARHQLVRTFSLGMRQRLGLALAWLGEPELLILDEPTNGLDPAGMRDIRGMLRDLPRTQGTTVFVSSHLLGEVEQVASHVGVLHQGRLRFQGTLGELKAGTAGILRVGTGAPERAARILAEAGFPTTLDDQGRLRMPDPGVAEAARLNSLLVTGGVEVHLLAVEDSSLEHIFLGLTEPA
jgi:ABC-type multidrug transport system ATPase subunit